MGRLPHHGRKEQMKVKSFRLSEDELNAIKAFMNEEEVGQSTALRALIQYGILYYTMYVLDEESQG